MTVKRIQKRNLTAVVTAVTSICLVYANSFANGFHFDDYHTIVNNPAIRSLSNIPRFFTDAKTFSILPANQTYRPIVSTTLAFDYWMGHGLKPFYFHIGTFLVYLLQLAAMLLLFRIVMNRTRPEKDHFVVATFAAAWYGLHPAMAETVNYIIQRGDVYEACGVVYAMLIFIALPQWGRTGLYLLPFILGLLSKPPTIVFPALLFAYLAMFEAPPERRYRYAAWRSLPAFVVGALVMAFEAAMTPKSFTPSTLSNFSWYITQPYVLLRTFVTFFLPLHLNVDTGLRAFDRVNAEAVAGFAFVVVLVAAIAWLSISKHLRPIAFGLLWFLIGSLPTALYKLSEVTNEHRLFLPFIGMALACTWAGYLGISWLAQRAKRRWIWKAATACGLLMLGTYGWAAHIRNRVWHTNLSLWYDDVLKCPDNGRGLMNYGLAQMDRGHDKIALHYFEKALKYTPDYPTLEINLGIVNGLLADQGQTWRDAQAQEYFLRAIALAPGSALPHAYYGRWLLTHGHNQAALNQLSFAVRLNPQPLMPRDLLMDAEERIGDDAAARRLALQTLRISPTDGIARSVLKPSVRTAGYWVNQSLFEYRQAQYQLAIASARHALTIDPHSAAAYNNIGASYGELKQWKKAVRNERLALRYNPQLAIAKNNLALFLRKQTPGATRKESAATVNGLIELSLRQYQAGRYVGCIQAAQDALRVNPRSAEAWNNIAAGEAALHHWKAAVRAAGEALALKPNFTLARNNLAWAESHLHNGAR